MHQPKTRSETGRSVGFYAALGLVTAATLMLQIIETRIISVTSWYHLAFFVISLAMFGLTAGAIFVYLNKERFRPERLSYDLAVATLAFALSTDLAILVQLTLVTGASPSLTSLVAWAEFAICLAFPFFFSGVVVSLALTRSPYSIGKVYGADLIGAAIGCIGALVILKVTSGTSAVLWVGAVIGLAALFFASCGLGNLHESAAPGATLFRYRRGILACCLLLRLATCSRSMASDRRSSKINWKRRPGLPMIAGIHFPASPSVKATQAHQRRGGLRRAFRLRRSSSDG
jgi:hypothetical protein